MGQLLQEGPDQGALGCSGWDGGETQVRPVVWGILW